MDPDERAFDEILVGFSSGADPLYNDYKELIGPFHWTPLEILSSPSPQGCMTTIMPIVFSSTTALAMHVVNVAR